MIGFGFSLSSVAAQSAVMAPPPPPPPPQAAWTPEDGLVSGTLLAWWEPSTDTTYDDFNGTTSASVDDEIWWMHDRSGNDIHLRQHNGSHLPVLQSALGTSSHRLSFDSSERDRLYSTSFSSGDVDLTLVVAGDFQFQGGDRQYVFVGGDGNGNPGSNLLIFALRNGNGGGAGRMGIYDGTAWRDFESGQGPAGYQVATFRLDRAGLASGYRDGALVGSSPWSPQGLIAPISLMSRDSGNNFTKGDIHTILLFEGALSDTDRALAETYAESQLPRRLAFSNVTTVGSDVRASQGVAIDPRGFLFTTAQGANGGETNKMVNTYAWDGTSVGALLHSFNGVDAMTAASEQVNGLYFDAATNKLYSGANNWNTTPYAGWVVEYDVASDGSLAYVAEHSVGAHVCEGCALYDGSWWVVYHDLHEIHQYDLSWGFVAAHSLPAPDPGDGSTAGNYYQGIAWRDDVAYVNCHGLNENAPKMLAFRWTGSAFEFAATLTPPENATQGFVFDGDTMLLSVRTQANGAAPNHVLRADVAPLQEIGGG